MIATVGVGDGPWSLAFSPKGAEVDVVHGRTNALFVLDVSSYFEALGGHGVVENLAEGQGVLKRLQELLAETFCVKHVTIQLEERGLDGEEGRF